MRRRSLYLVLPMLVALVALACSSGKRPTLEDASPSATVPAPTESPAGSDAIVTPIPSGLPEATITASSDSLPNINVLSIPDPKEYPEGSNPGALRFTYEPRSPWTKTNFNKRAVPLLEFYSGGPLPDGILPLDDPQFETIIEADGWITESEPLMVFVHDGIVKGYPLQVMLWHEIANDTIGDLPILVSY